MLIILRMFLICSVRLSGAASNEMSWARSTGSQFVGAKFQDSNQQSPFAPRRNKAALLLNYAYAK